MLTVVDRYLMRQVVTTTAALTGLGLAILLLERVLRLFGLVASPNKALTYVGQMLVLLLPHFLSIALPAALFLGILLTFQRLERDSEFVVLSAAGRSLGRLLRPVLGLALVMTALALLIVGVLGPHARYGYRVLKDAVAEASLTAAVLEETFVHAGDLTFFAEDAVTTADGARLAQVFIHEDTEGGGSIVMTGRDGFLGQVPGSEVPVLVLREGVRAEFPAEGGPAGSLRFEDFSWPVLGDEEGFRPRGGDQRELTLTELWRAQASESTKPTAAEVAAELGARAVMVASIPVLPFLAAALALLGDPRRRRLGVVVGLLILIVYHEALSFGESLAKRDLISPWLGLGAPYLLLLIGTGWMYLRVGAGRPLLPDRMVRA
jgi:lipopolysaccharide export system permease protein